MKRPILLLLTALFLTATACAGGTNDNAAVSTGSTSDSTETGETMNITVTIGAKTFTATLTDSATTRALIAKFPLTVSMSELNGNEYYAYLDGSLPTASKNPRTIATGDIKLYGSNCLVIFYKSFSTSYSYTSLGRVGAPAGLETALKASGGKVTFAIAD